MGEFLNWKTVALSALACISVLLGILDRWNDDRIDNLQSANAKQWEHIRELTDRYYELRERVKSLEIRTERR